MASKQTILPDNIGDLLYVKRLQKGKFTYCGYKKEYLVKKLSEMEEGFVTCSVCSGITRKATLYRGETTCLVCSVSQTEMNPVKLVQNAVNRLEIKCPLMRCTWNGILSEAETHLDNCTRFLIQCELCEVIVERGQYENHIMFSCLLREMECEHCYKELLYKDLKKHSKICPEYPIFCTNGCREFLLRKQLSQHRSECLLEVITCPYEKFGCNAIPMLRRDLLAHKKKFYIEHQDMSLNEIQELNNEIVRLDKEIFRLDKEKQDLYCDGKMMLQLDGVEWEIQNARNLKVGHSIIGPAFYVKRYALKIYLIPTQFETCRTIFRFALKRIEGEFDSNLGKAYLTQYRIILVNQQDRSESYTSQSEMNYDLKIRTHSGIIFGKVFCKDYVSCLTENRSLQLKLYFDVKLQ